MDLNHEIIKRADIFDIELEKFLKKEQPKDLYDAVRHLPLAGGKRIRPVISIVSCELISGDLKNAIPLAIALELIHNFTLVHDDIMDRSYLRRKLPSVHVKFGESTAIIAGDLLFAKAFESMNTISSDYSVFKQLNSDFISCIEEICEGQQLDMEFEQRRTVTEKEYIDMIMKKTAVLFMFAAGGGGILGKGISKEVKALKEYGKCLGLGFQIWDDYLDISSDEKTLGKDIGNDIRNGKKTLIAVHTLNKAKDNDKKLLEKIFGNKNATDEDIRIIHSLFKKLKSIEFAKNTALNYITKAKDSISIFKDSKYKQILIELADYSIEREN